MPVYDFRLRFNFPEAYRIDSDLEELELLVLQPGERIRLRSGAIGTPIKDHAHAAVLGESYASEDQARAAAEKAKRALLYRAVEQRLGIDFGDGKQRSMVTEAGLAMLPDIIDKPIGMVFFNTGWMFGHSLLFALILLVTGLLL